MEVTNELLVDNVLEWRNWLEVEAQIRKEQKKASFNSRYTVLKVIATSESST